MHRCHITLLTPTLLLLLPPQLINKRPLSPDVFELGSMTQPHYKMPWGALSSIANRATGAALSAGGQQQQQQR